MINIPNQQFTKWLLPINNNRRTELLCDIGLDQEEKGFSKRTIVKIFQQLYASPLVKLKPLKKELEHKLLTRNGEFKEENLFINSDINVSEYLRQHEYDTDTVEDVCLPVITSVISLRDDDEDSIEISLSEEDPCENTERKLEDKLKHEENIKSSITQPQVNTPKSTPNEKLHLEVQEKDKGVDDIGKTSNNYKKHQVKEKNKHITTNQPMACTKDTKDKTDTLSHNSLVVKKNKQDKIQMLILQEKLGQILESKNISLPLSNNCKSLVTTSNIDESRQKSSALIKKIGVEFSTESREEYTVLNSSEMKESVQMEVGQLEESTSELNTEGNDRSNNKLNRSNICYSNSQQQKNNTEMENPPEEFVSYTPTNQRLPYKKRLADQSRGTQQVSKRRRMSATDIVDRSLSLKQLSSDSSTITQLKQPGAKNYVNQDYSFLSRSLTAVPTHRRYSLDLNPSMTKQNGSKVLSDISSGGKSNTNNTTKGHTVDQMPRCKEFTESKACAHKDVETGICSDEEFVKHTVIDNAQSYSFNNLEKSLDLNNKSIEDSVKSHANQLYAVTRSTSPANQAPAVQKCTDFAKQAPAVPTSTVTANVLPAVAICTVSENQTPAVLTRTAPVNQTLAVPTCTATANKSPTVLTYTDPVNKKLAAPTCTAPMNQAPAVPTLVFNALMNEPSKEVVPQYQRSFSLKHTSIQTAVSLFFDNFESNQTVDHIPPAIRSELLEFLKIKGTSTTHIADRDILQLYLWFYIEFFNKDVSEKIKKSAEILHLAIADYNRKIERKKRALRLSSDTFRKEEEMRAHNEYSEMLNLRGIKFSEIFDSILVHFKNCASSMAVTLYYRITLALMNIDRENTIYTYQIRGLILNLLKSAIPLRKFPSCCSNLFQAPINDFESTYMFVKTCLVILHAVGYYQHGSEDVLKFANHGPTSLKIKHVLNNNLNHNTIETSTAVGYMSQSESGIANTCTNSNIYPNNAVSTLKNNTNAIFVNSQNIGITSEPVGDLRQTQETLKPPQHQLSQLQDSHRDIAYQNYKSQSSPSELINQQQINMANSMLPHLISKNDMQNRDTFKTKQQIPENSISLKTPSQNIYNHQFVQVTIPNNVLPNISKTHPSQQTPSQQTYLRHNTFTSENVNQREADKMSRSDPQTVKKSQEVEVKSKAVTNTASSNIQVITANSQTTSLCNSVQGPSPDLKNNPLFSNNLSLSNVCDADNCSKNPILVCSLCKKKVYCSYYCQGSDWYNRHSKSCQ